jgi:hypothetical protein
MVASGCTELLNWMELFMHVMRVLSYFLFVLRGNPTEWQLRPVELALSVPTDFDQFCRTRRLMTQDRHLFSNNNGK